MKPSRKLLSSVIFFSMSSFLAQAASDITISNQVNSDITGSSPFRDATDNGGTSNLQVVTLVGALGTSNVVVTTNTGSGTGPFGGRIEVKDSVTWNAANSLSLNADSNIIVGATINSIGGGSLSLNAGGTVSFDADITMIGAPAGLSVASSGVTQTIPRKLVVEGQADIDGGSGDVTLLSANRFGSLSLGGAAVTVNEADATLLTGVASSTLTLNSAGSITDAPNTTISVTGLAHLNAGANAIILGDSPGDSTNFGSLNLTGSNVSITEDSSSELAGVSATTFTLNSNGAQTDTGNLSVTGLATFNAGSNDIILGDNPAEITNFGTLNITGGAVSINEDSNMDLVGSNSAGSAALSSSGALSDASAASVSVTGLGSFSGSSISLGGGTFNTGSITFNSSGAVSIAEDSDMDIVGVNTGGTTNLSSTGGISDAGATSVNVGSLTIAGTSISLGGGIFNATALNFNSTGAVVIAEDSSMDLVGSNTAGSASLSSTGALSDAGATNVAITGLGSFSGTSISLGGGAFNTGSLNFNSTGAVNIQEDSATVLTGVNTGSSLLLNSSGAVTDLAGTSLAISSGATINAGGLTSIVLDDTAFNVGGNTFLTAGAGQDIIVNNAANRFDGTVTFVASTGTLANVNVFDTTNFDLQALTVTNSLTAISGGALTDSGNLSVNGLATFGGSSITIGGASELSNFGSLTFNSTGVVNIQEDSSTLLTGTSTGQDLSLTSVAGIANDGTADLTITDNASFNGTSITLGTTAGDSMNFGSLTFNSGGAVTIEEDSSTLLTGTSTGQSLDLSSAGDIANTGTADLTVTDNASFDGTSITLGTTAGDSMNFGSLTFNSTGAVTIEEDSSTLLAGTSTGQILDLTSLAAITNTATANLTVTDNASFDGTSITLGTTAGDSMNFGSLTFNSGGAVTIEEDSSTLLTGTSTGQSLDLSSVGDIANTATANLTITDNASFDGTSITLGTSAGDSMNFGSLTFNSTGAVTVEEDSSTLLSGTSTSQSLDLTSLAGITNTGTADLTITDNASFNGTSIMLGTSAGDSMNFGSLTFNSAGAVTIEEDSSTLLTGTSISQSLVLTSLAEIANTAAANLTVTDNASFSGTGITLGTSAGDSVNFGSLTFNSGGAVTIEEDSDTLLTGTSTGQSLDLSSAGDIANTGTADLTITDNASFDGTSITLGTTAGDSMNFGSLTFSSAGAVTIAEDSDMDLVGVNTGGTTTLASVAAISDSGATRVTTGPLAVSGSSISLGGGIFDASTLNFNSPGLVSIAEDSSMDIVGVNTAGSAALSSVAALSDAGAASIDIAGSGTFSGTSIELGAGIFNTGSLTFDSAGAVNITEDSSTLLTGTSTANVLALGSAGSIANDTFTNLTVVNHARFDGTSITLGSVGSDSMNFGTLSFNATGGVTIQEDSSTHLTGTSTAGSLELASAGALTDESDLAVVGLATLSGSSMMIGGAGQTTHFGSLNVNSPGLVEIQEDSDTSFVGRNSANILRLISSGVSTFTSGSTLDAVTLDIITETTSLTGNNLSDLMEVRLSTGTTLTLSGSDTIARLESNGGTIAGTAILTATDGALLNGGVVSGHLRGDTTAVGNVLVSGSVGDGFLQVGSGTLTLAGTSGNDLVEILAGATLVDSSGGLSANADVTNAGRLAVESNDRVRTYTQNGTGALVGSALLSTSHGAILSGGSVSGNLRGKTTTNGQVLVTGSLGGGSLLIEAGTLTLVGSSSNGRIRVSDGAVLVDSRGGLSASSAVSNFGRIVVNADDTVATYTQGRGGVLAGRASLTATGGALLNGGRVNGTLLGDIESAGEVGITGTVGGGGLLVSRGTLTLTGTANADTQVNEGAILKGDGFINGNLLNRGTTALSLTISGSLVTTGTVTMSFNNPTDFDRIKAGSADLGGGLIVTNTGTGLASGETTQIIDAGAYSNSFATFEAFHFDNGVLFNNQTGMLVGLGGGRTHAGGTYLNLNRNQTNTYLALFEDSVQPGTRNVFRNGDAIDFASGATNGDADLVNALYQATFTSTGGIDVDTVNSLSPEVYAGLVDYTKQALRAHSRAAMETAPVARKGRTEFFATAHTHTAGVDNSTTNAGYDTDMNGATAGMRYDVDGKIHVGGFIGVDDGTISGNLIDADAQGYSIGTFASYQFEDSRRTSVFGSLSYGDYSHDTMRRSFGGDGSADGIASDAFELLVGTSTVLYEKEGFLISPSAAFRYMSGGVDGFTETGAGVPLTVDSQDIDSFLLDLAVDFTYDVTDRFSVSGRVGYAQELSETDHTVSSTFAATGAGGQGFQVTAPGMDDQALILGAGLFYDVSDAARIGATYRGEFGSDSKPTQSIGIGATFAF